MQFLCVIAFIMHLPTIYTRTKLCTNTVLILLRNTIHSAVWWCCCKLYLSIMSWTWTVRSDVSDVVFYCLAVSTDILKLPLIRLHITTHTSMPWFRSQQVKFYIWQSILPRDAMHSANYVVARYPSVHPSVRPSVSFQMTLSDLASSVTRSIAWSLQQLVVLQGFYFFPEDEPIGAVREIIVVGFSHLSDSTCPLWPAWHCHWTDLIKYSICQYVVQNECITTWAFPFPVAMQTISFWFLGHVL